MLAKAKEIVIVHADETEKESAVISAARLAENLRRYGGRVEVQELPHDGRSASHRLRDSACEMNADLMVMGGYGHSRLREFVFGGVTSDVIGGCAIPVLLFH